MVIAISSSPEQPNQPGSIDLVVPLYNEQETIERTYQRLAKLFGPLRNAALEPAIIFVDDGSTDNSSAILRRIAQADNAVKVLMFSRNFGHQAAITAGLAHSNADFSVVLDADLQDPPELVTEMLELTQKGFDVVFGQRKRREGETAFKKITAALFYKLLNIFSTVPVPRNVGDFRLVTRRGRELFLQAPEKARLNRAIFAWAGLKQTHLLYDRPQRAAGETKYHLTRMCSLAMDGIANASGRPITLIGITATLFLVLSTLTACFGRLDLAGVLFSGSLVLYGLAICGVYIGRLYFNLRRRPSYLISQIITGSQADDPPQGGNHLAKGGE